MFNKINKTILFDKILPRVENPARYTGHELNSIKKDHSSVKASIALLFPDLYDVGMSYYGFQILYHILNKDKEIVAERAYAPWPDFEEKLRQYSISLYSLESITPLKNFDIIGFSLSYELCYTNVLNMLDLSGIPIFSEERREEHPFVIAGGGSTYNPEPMSQFVDFFVIGDAEEIIVPVVKFTAEKRRQKIPRMEILKQLAAEFQGIYVPVLYEYEKGTDGFLHAKPKFASVPERVIANRVLELLPEYYPAKPIVPLIDIAQNRLVAEIMRGCTRGCRFCQAGMIYRPVRERKSREITDQVKATMSETGYCEMSMLSLSSSDYTGLEETVATLVKEIGAEELSISFPSLHLDSFTEKVADYAKLTRKSGLTFAPEAGSERLRRIINKQITGQELCESAEIAVRKGYRSLKLYFMLGLPHENMEDLTAISDLSEKVLHICKGPLSLNVTLSSFVPKPFTPFQWEAQDDPKQMQDKLDVVKQNLRNLKKIKPMGRDPRYSQLEGVMSRGDRMIGNVIYEAWKMGAKFDSWREYFSPDIWLTAFEKCGIDPVDYTKSRDAQYPLPWEIIDPLITRKYLLSERAKSLTGEQTRDCRDGCTQCGVCKPGKLQMKIAGRTEEIEFPDLEMKEEQKTCRTKYRLVYRKTDAARYISHHDTLRMFQQTFLRAQLKLVYSQGYNKKPKISAGLVLPFGYTSDQEFLDIVLKHRQAKLMEILNAKLPEGFEISGVEQLPKKNDSVFSQIIALYYRVDLNSNPGKLLIERIEELLSSQKILIDRKKKNKVKQIEVRPFIENIERNEKRLLIRLNVIEGRSVKMLEILELLKISDSITKIHRINTILR